MSGSTGSPLEPYEVLEALDQANCVVYFSRPGTGLSCRCCQLPLLGVSCAEGRVPAWLSEAVQEHHEALHQIMLVEEGRDPNMLMRQPNWRR